MTQQQNSRPLSAEALVRRSPDVLFRNLSGEAVLLHLKTGRYFGLDPVGTRIWELLESKERISDLLASIVDEFDVDSVTAGKDLLELLSQMQAQGLVAISTSST